MAKSKNKKGIKSGRDGESNGIESSRRVSEAAMKKNEKKKKSISKSGISDTNDDPPPEETSEETPERYKSAKHTIDDDDVFDWLMDMESLKNKKRESYKAEDLLKQFPQHQWLLRPSIKWDKLKDEKEKERIHKLELEALAALYDAEMEGEYEEDEGADEKIYRKSLEEKCHRHRRRHPDCHCHGKGRRRKKSVDIGTETDDENEKRRKKKSTGVSWFGQILTTAHHRRPSWAATPNDIMKEIRNKTFSTINEAENRIEAMKRQNKRNKTGLSDVGHHLKQEEESKDPTTTTFIDPDKELGRNSKGSIGEKKKRKSTTEKIKSKSSLDKLKKEDPIEQKKKVKSQEKKSQK